MVVELTIGDGKPAQKTLQYRAIKDKAIQSDFVYLDNVAFTPKFFRRFLERSGAFEGGSPNEISGMIAYERFTKSEKNFLLEGWNSLQQSNAKVKVRSDEPWAGPGTGLGLSWNATENSLEQSVKSVLSSQFSSDVRAFKRLKGIDEDFGIMLMPLVNAYASLNYLGKFNNRAIVQYASGYSTKFIDTKTFEGAVESAHFSGFDRRISRLLELDGNCYLEAIQNEGSRQSSWTVVQHSPYALPMIQKPKFEPGSVLCATQKVIGTGLVETKGIRHVCHKTEYEDQEFNAANKNYLLFIEHGCLEDFRQIPLDHYSNAGAILVSVHMTENHPFSHVGGFLRELSIPFLIVDRSFNNDYDKMKKELLANPNAHLLIYANEFKREGIISADVLLEQNKRESG